MSITGKIKFEVEKYFQTLLKETNEIIYVLPRKGKFEGSDRELIPVHIAKKIFIDDDIAMYGTIYLDEKSQEIYMQNKYDNKFYLLELKSRLENNKTYPLSFPLFIIYAVKLNAHLFGEKTLRLAKKFEKVLKQYVNEKNYTILDLNFPEKKFVPLLNGTAINDFTIMNTSFNKLNVDNITGKATIEQGDLKVFIEEYSTFRGIKTSTLKLLDIFTMRLTNQNTYRGDIETINPTVSISIDQYMSICDIPITKSSKDKTRIKIRDDLKTLYNVSLEYAEKNRKSESSFVKMRICDKVSFVRGIINFNFSKDVASYLVKSYIMKYPMELLKVDERNSNLYPLGRKLALHYGMKNNRKIGTFNTISVKSLLYFCPSIPSYDEVMEKDRALKRKIQVPFEKALDSLNFIEWKYSDSKGNILDGMQSASIDYQTFIKLYINYEIKGFD